MGNHNTSGRDPDANHGSWRPDDDMGQGQSGYGAGRSRDDHAFSGANQRNQAYAGRQQDTQGNTDDRWSGRGGSPRDSEDRDYDPERYGAQGGYGGGSGFEDRFGGRTNMGYAAHGQQGYGPQGYGQGRDGNQGNQGFADRAGFDRGGFDRSAGDRGGDDRMQGQRMHPAQTRSQSWNAYGPQNEAPRSYGSDQSMYGQGQRGQHRGKGPQGYQRSDERIRENVCEALEHDEHVDATHIEVVVQNGEVILTGTVEDRAMKRMAEACVEHLAGVKDVQNSLRVGGDRGARSNGNKNGNAGNGMGKNESEPSATTSSDKKARA